MYKGNLTALYTVILSLCFTLISSQAFAAFVITPDKAEDIGSTLTPSRMWQKKHFDVAGVNIKRDIIVVQAVKNSETFDISLRYNYRPSVPPTFFCLETPSEKLSLCLNLSEKKFKTSTRKYHYWLKKNTKAEELESFWKEIREKVQQVKKPPLDEKYFAKQALEERAKFVNPISYAKPVKTCLWWAWPSAIAIFLVVMILLLLPYRSDRQVLNNGLTIAFLSLASRSLVPNVLLHVQTDDLNLVASARGLVELVSTHARSGMLLQSLGFILEIWGDNIDSIFIVAHLFGALLPLLAYLLAMEWYRDRQLAVVSGVLLLVSPVAIAYSGAITAYMPMAVIFAIALFVSLLILRISTVKAVLLLPLVTVLLLYVGLLKEEFLILLPAQAVLILGFYLLNKKRNLSFFKLVLALAPILIAGLLILSSYDMFMGEFSKQLDERTGRVSTRIFEAVISYFVVGLIFANPPFLPFKIAMVISGIRAETRKSIPLILVFFALSSIYMLSNMSVGFNQWRHSLIFILPLYLAATPTVYVWWREQRDVKWAKIMLILMILFNLAGYVYYGNAINNLRQDGFKLVKNLEHSEKILTIYSPLSGDLDSVNLFAATGTTDYMSLVDIYPASCKTGMKLRKIAVREKMVWSAKSSWFNQEDYFGKAEKPEYFYNVEKLEDDIDWYEKTEIGQSGHVKHSIETARHSLFEIAELEDQGRCKRHQTRIKELLSSYDRIQLFINSGLIRKPETSWRKFADNLHEYLDLSADSILLEHKISFLKPEMILVKMILDPECDKGVKGSDDCIIWRMK